MTRRLVILGCSQTKRPEPGYMPARQRYDGPLWQTLRAADPEGRKAAVAVLSARYGFIDARFPIQDYNQRLTPQLAEAMIAGGLGTRWPRPTRADKPDNLGSHAACEIDSMTLNRAFEIEPFEEIAICGGGLYLIVMRAFVEQFRALGYVTADARVVEINGQIGYMRRDLRAWLEGETLAVAPAAEPVAEVVPAPAPVAAPVAQLVAAPAARRPAFRVTKDLGRLERLSTELNSFLNASRDDDAFGFLIRAENRLLDAAVACGMPYSEPDPSSWAAEVVTGFLCAA